MTLIPTTERTAMQMLIESINGRLVDQSDKTAVHNLEICLMVAKALLQKEQEQIEQAFDNVESVKYLNGDKFYKNGHHYYQSKYGGENETNSN